MTTKELDMMSMYDKKLAKLEKRLRIMLRNKWLGRNYYYTMKMYKRVFKKKKLIYTQVYSG